MAADENVLNLSMLVKQAERQEKHLKRAGVEVNTNAKEYPDIFYKRYAALANMENVSVKQEEALRKLQIQLNEINIFNKHFHFEFRLAGRYSPHLRMVCDGMDMKDEWVKDFLLLLTECGFKATNRYHKHSVPLIVIFGLEAEGKFASNHSKLVEFAQNYNSATVKRRTCIIL